MDERTNFGHLAVIQGMQCDQNFSLKVYLTLHSLDYFSRNETVENFGDVNLKLEQIENQDEQLLVE